MRRALRWFISLGIVVLGLSLTPSVTAQPSSVTQGLVAYYPLDGDAHDASGNHFDGAAFGTRPATNRFGVANHALLFNGATDFINCGNPAAFNFTNSFSICAWVNPTNHSSDLYIVAKYNATMTAEAAHSYGLAVGRTTEAYGFVSGNGPGYQEARGTQSLSDGRWHFLVLVYDRSFGLRVYSDNILAASVPAPNYPAFTNQYPLTIGRAFSGQAFSGLIDEVRIYNKALSPEEINTLFIQENGPGIQISNAVKLSMLTTKGITYQIEGSSNLEDWFPVLSPFTAQDSEAIFYLDAADSYRYFRLKRLN